MIWWVEDWDEEEEMKGGGWSCDVESVEEEEKVKVFIETNDFSKKRRLWLSFRIQHMVRVICSLSWKIEDKQIEEQTQIPWVSHIHSFCKLNLKTANASCTSVLIDLLDIFNQLHET